MAKKVYDYISDLIKWLFIGSNDGHIYLVETIPSQLRFNDEMTLPGIGESIIELIKEAKSKIDLSSVYVSLMSNDSNISGKDDIGCTIFQELIEAANRGVKIRIVVNSPTKSMAHKENKRLIKENPKNITIGYLDMAKILSTKIGFHHTKLLIVDDTSFYLGSANMDWKAFSEVAEIGLIGKNIPCAALDLSKIFTMYWGISYRNKPPPYAWPAYYDSLYNQDNLLMAGSEKVPIYFSVSPDLFNSLGRMTDLDAILGVIDSQSYGTLRICSMEFSNCTSYEDKNYFWGKIDYALRKAMMERNVVIHLMVESKELKNSQIRRTLDLLHKYGKIIVRTITFPNLDVDIPFARSFHSKLCIGNKKAWLGTSNLTPEYFQTVSGIGAVIYGTTYGGKSFINTLTKVFDRYYNSEYASDLKPASET